MEEVGGFPTFGATPGYYEHENNDAQIERASQLKSLSYKVIKYDKAIRLKTV